MDGDRTKLFNGFCRMVGLGNETSSRTFHLYCGYDACAIIGKRSITDPDHLTFTEVVISYRTRHLPP